MVGHEDSRDKHRWGESKLVYMRKGHAKPNPNPNPGFDGAQQGQGQGQGQTLRRMESDNSMVNMVDGNGRAATATSNGSSSLGMKNDDAPKETCTRSIDAAHVTIKLDGYSKQEIGDLRRKLTQELEQVRGTFKKVEARELRLRGCYGGAGNTCHSASQFSGNHDRNNGWKEVTSEVASVGAITPRQSLRECKPLAFSLIENIQATNDVADKGKRTPKANRYYRNSEFVLGKEKFPPTDNSKSKSGGNKKIAQSKRHELSSQNFPNDFSKQCNSLLAKLMKHKHGWVFNAPVDAEALGLHDYHTIIKNPMDLGTVKSKLEKNLYNSPTSFAEDMRLTLSNAMTYNPEGHDVHILAKQLLQLFEERWKFIYAEHIEGTLNSRYGSGQAPGASCSVKKLTLSDIKKNVMKSETSGGSSPSKIRPINYPASRIPTGKKPKAKDPHKRAMSFDEKQKLSASLQNLPTDRMELIVQIIKKRNPSLCQQDEEIEVDIDTFDTETLWELDRSVTNHKKSLCKLKKKELLAQQAKSANGHGLARDKCLTTGCELLKKNKKGEQGEEEVEIDDSMPPSNCPPVEIEKDGGSGSRSSSSSTSSSDSGSSSGESDSGSSSESESDAYAAHSPISGSKVMPRG